MCIRNLCLKHELDFAIFLPCTVFFLPSDGYAYPRLSWGLLKKYVTNCCSNPQVLPWINIYEFVSIIIAMWVLYPDQLNVYNVFCYMTILYDGSRKSSPECHLPNLPQAGASESLNKQPNWLEMGFAFLFLL